MTDHKHKWENECFEEDITCLECEIRLDVYEEILEENRRVLNPIETTITEKCFESMTTHVWHADDDTKKIQCSYCGKNLSDIIDSLRLEGDEK